MILKGVFDFVGTHGVPLEIVLDLLKSKGLMPDWLDYIDSAVRQGAKQTRVRLQLSNAILDVYGQEFHDPWLVTFDEILAYRDRHPSNG